MENLKVGGAKALIRVSRNNWMRVSKGGKSIWVPVNLVKHALQIPYTRKDGTFKSAFAIEQENFENLSCYEAQILKLAQDLPSEDNQN